MKLVIGKGIAEDGMRSLKCPCWTLNLGAIATALGGLTSEEADTSRLCLP